MRIANLKNLGPKMEQWLQEIGIKDAAEFLTQDPFKIYQQLQQSHPQIGLNALYAMIGAHENCHWLEIKQQQKTSILYKLDDLGIAP